MFIVLEDLSKKRTLEILESAEKEPNSKIGNAFAHYLDRATVLAKGLTPIKHWLEEIKGLSSKADYASLAAKANRNGVDGPFGAFVGQDDKDPETYILSFYQSGLGMPDRDYYLDQSDRMKQTRAAYVAHQIGRASCRERGCQYV